MKTNSRDTQNNKHTFKETNTHTYTLKETKTHSKKEKTHIQREKTHTFKERKHTHSKRENTHIQREKTNTHTHTDIQRHSQSHTNNHTHSHTQNSSPGLSATPVDSALLVMQSDGVSQLMQSRAVVSASRERERDLMVSMRVPDGGITSTTGKDGDFVVVSGLSVFAATGWRENHAGFFHPFLERQRISIMITHVTPMCYGPEQPKIETQMLSTRPLTRLCTGSPAPLSHFLPNARESESS